VKTQKRITLREEWYILTFVYATRAKKRLKFGFLSATKRVRGSRETGVGKIEHNLQCTGYEINELTRTHVCKAVNRKRKFYKKEAVVSTFIIKCFIPSSLFTADGGGGGRGGWGALVFEKYKQPA